MAPSGKAPLGIGFDIDHTIAIDNKLERIALLQLLAYVTEHGGHTAPTLDEETTVIDVLLMQSRRGDFSIDEAVRRFVRGRNMRASDDGCVQRFRATALALVDSLVVPLPGAKETFAALRARGVRMAVLTNGWNPLQVRKARRAGFDDAVLVSSDLGVQKPDVAAYAALMAELHTPPERTWYVGDDPIVDVNGARSAGLRAVWLDAEARSFPSGVAAAPRRITALPELVGLLGVDQGGAPALAPQESA